MLSERTTPPEIPPVLAKYQLKALPTIYGGINYRSRIEARWAVFFDTLGIPFEYEKEGFDLGDDQLYLPDFWLPQQKFWVEINGADPDEDACDKAHRLAVASSHEVFVFFGGITLPDSQFGPPVAYAFFPDGGGDSQYMWCQCPNCQKFGVEFEGRTDRLPCKECYLCWNERNKRPTKALSVLEQFQAAINAVNTLGSSQEISEHQRTCKKPKGCPRFGGNGDRGHNENSDRLCAAYSAARAIRFGR